MVAPDPANRVELDVDEQSDAVAKRAGPEERYLQIRSVSDTPAPERLTEVFLVFLKPELGSDVDEAGYPDRGVQCNAPYV